MNRKENLSIINTPKKNWVQIDSYKPRVVADLAILYDDKTKRISMRISSGLLEKLGWKLGDKITLFYNAENEREIMITKTSVGYSISAWDKPRGVGIISFKWSGKSIFKKQKAVEAGYTIEGTMTNPQLITILPRDM